MKRRKKTTMTMTKKKKNNKNKTKEEKKKKTKKKIQKLHRKGAARVRTLVRRERCGRGADPGAEGGADARK